MREQLMREELKRYYWQGTAERAERFYGECKAELDALYRPEMSAYEMKALQYRVISERLEPVLFYHTPFYFETGTMWAHSDGALYLRGHRHAAAWTHAKNKHLYVEQDPALWERRSAQGDELFYLICGAYNDETQHFNFNLRPIYKEGIKGLCEKAQAALETARDAEERQFLSAMCTGLLAWKRIAEKFADRAEKMLPDAPDEESRFYLRRIAETARRVPWEKPQTFFEALNCCAFLRKALGTLEGVGSNTFGRLDLDLEPFYTADLQAGRLTNEGAFELIKQFLITFDMHYDHDMKMVGYADHELENTFVLGGCDRDGNPVYNALTRLFLRAVREAKTIFPKPKCRYGKNSPPEYLDEIDKSVIAGSSVVLFHNDDEAIPAFVRMGVPLQEARDYLVTGCWGVLLNETEKLDGGGYVNLLKPFEYALHRRTDKMERVGMQFQPFDDAKDFEALYKTVLDNIRILLRERSEIARKGGGVWSRVAPLPLFSSTLANCLETRRDYTAGGAKYQDDAYLMVGFPNLVDSLLAIKTLCFDRKICTLEELLRAVRENWEGYVVLRAEAMRCPGWGDGSDASCAFANRFNNDLFAMLGEFSACRGGKIRLGHLTYTEIRFWGEQTLATPDGRRNGEYIAQGLTPSRLKKIPNVTDVIRSLKSLDPSTMAGGSVVNVILPSDKVDLERCRAFLYAAADTAMASLQLNCVTRAQLLDAQEHPELYGDLIVRVTGFSAKFTSLSPEWQQEVLSRNFYE